MVGTLFNSVTVLIGASVGLAVGKRWSTELKDKVFIAIGLFTLSIAIMMALGTDSPIDLFVALVLGGILGHSLRLQDRMGQWQSKRQGTSGFVEAMMLFCMGSMTLVGCMEDGLLAKPDLLIVKGTMDLISSAFLAATLGRGVLWASAGVLLFQGGLTLAFRLVGEGLDPHLIQELSALGGILMLGLGFQLLGFQAPNKKPWPLVDLLPAFALLPLIHWIHHMLIPPF